MKIETKLTLNNIRKNIKRTIYTTISMILCTILILTTMLLISSIRNGITENIETKYNDYHFIIKDLDIKEFNKIKDKEYIKKIYIKEKDKEQLEELEKPYNLEETGDNLDIYIKYDNIKGVCEYSNDIIKTLNLTYDDARNKCEFNEKLLTVNGLIDVKITILDGHLICKIGINYSFIIDLMIILIILVFSILFVIILYNAFLITINERKKEYAILNSIGGTEGQILKTIFLEAVIMGVIAILIGGVISVLNTNIVLKVLNNILSPIRYNFRLVIDIRYILVSLCIIIINIYISALIPSVKASTTSVIQGIKNNRQIKNKKKVGLLEKILPIEGKIAIKNIKRNKNKYRVITILLVICMTSYIVVNTYISYEKEASDLVTVYDVDAELSFDEEQKLDYKTILNNYKIESGDDIEYMEYKNMGLRVLVEPDAAYRTEFDDAAKDYDNRITYKDYKNEEKIVGTLFVGLDENTYNNYIKKINANYGDCIIYNNVTLQLIRKGEYRTIYKYYILLNKGYDLKLSIFSNDKIIDSEKFKIFNTEILNEKFILTDELIDSYKEIKTEYDGGLTIFTNMDIYNKIKEQFDNYCSKNEIKTFVFQNWLELEENKKFVKIKCRDIIDFSNYIEEYNKKQDTEEKKVEAVYYTLENQEKIIYIEIVKLILKVIILSIILIGIISTINIINASLSERKQEFKVLDSIGATKENINKILIYECVYMFIKAVVISIILSIPGIYMIIKYIENLIVLDKLLIPFGSISLFIATLFAISLLITICEARNIKEGN